MNMEFWMAGFLVIPKVYAVIASPFSKANEVLASKAAGIFVASQMCQHLLIMF
jgi:hypothetical protein